MYNPHCAVRIFYRRRLVRQRGGGKLVANNLIKHFRIARRQML
jgi:hypothetical protein